MVQRARRAKQKAQRITLGATAAGAAIAAAWTLIAAPGPPLSRLAVAVAGVGMLAGLWRPPARTSGRWLAILFLVGAAGFLFLTGGATLALFTGLGTWMGAHLATRKGDRSHFRSGAMGWWIGLCMGMWWLVR